MRAAARCSRDTRCSLSRSANTRAISVSTLAFSDRAVRRLTGSTESPTPPPAAQIVHPGVTAAARVCASGAATAAVNAIAAAASTVSMRRLANFNFHELHGGRAGVAHFVRDAGVEERPVADVVERPQARALRDG